ncbi:MAG: STAS domain-containing protein [Opitutales bacterium]|nr:STAS domain-containing protein [Opitutales bacterium]
MRPDLKPKLLSVLQSGYGKKDFKSDLIAGVIVGVIALPLAIAFAVASGVAPEKGLYTAIVAGFAIALLGGSRTQVCGPTGAFIPIIYAIVAQYGLSGLAFATVMAGVILVAMGLAKMGALLKFISYPVIVGFTAGIAVTIFSTQIPDLFGLSIPEKIPGDFIGKWSLYIQYFDTANWKTCLISLLATIAVFTWPRLTSKIPGALFVIVAATLAVLFLGWGAGTENPKGVVTIGSKFFMEKPFPSGFPMPDFGIFADLSFEKMRELIAPAFLIALLGSIESLLSAVVADGMTGRRHRPNAELVAQGVGNILSPIFGGIPATGAIARTAANIKNGGRTPIAALIHAGVLLAILLCLGEYIVFVPMCALGAVLVLVSYTMSGWRSFYGLLRTSPKSDIIVLILTFLLTVFVDLSVAIEVGVVLSAFLFLKRESETAEFHVFSRKQLGEDEYDPHGTLAVWREKLPDDVEIFEVFGSLFFGAVDQFRENFKRVGRKPKVFILDLSNLISIDATGIRAISETRIDMEANGTALVIAGLHPQPKKAIEHAGLDKEIGIENICPDMQTAISRSRSILAARKLATLRAKRAARSAKTTKSSEQQ